MDPITHGLASYALKRGFFPRLDRIATPFLIAAGVVADVDWVSYFYGPFAFLRWHLTFTHSLFSAALLSLLFGTVAFLFARKRPAPTGPLVIFGAALGAGLLHLAMDACQSAGVSLLWPFRSSRFALDWLPGFDPWILTILVAAILVPELFLLVSSEIGARTKRPRGRNGAIAGFVLLLLYAGARESLHASAVGTLRATAYAGESPHRVAAFPDSASLFTWHGAVETQTALHLLDVSVLPGAYFSLDSGVTVHKPENSRVLEVAQKTPAAREFLGVARFPKATVERETTGYSVEIRDLRYAALRQTTGAVEVNVNLDGSGNVTFQNLEWQKPRTRR